MRVLLFAHLKDVAGASELALDCHNVDAAELWTRLAARCPELTAFRSSVRLARNLEYAAPDTRFYADDEVALIPPVSGG
jgi:molybdopterin synthase sulfur carrier subunit